MFAHKRKPEDALIMRKATRSTTPKQLGFRMPAEWESHAATWLAWPYSKDWPGKLESVRWVFCEMARQITQGESGERVRMLVKSDAAIRTVRRWLTRADVNVERIAFFVAPTDRTWARDNLPLFVVNSDRNQLGAVKFAFNGWARYDDYKLDEKAGLAVATTYGNPLWKPMIGVGSNRRFVLEGGSVDVDGSGTVLTTRDCLLGSRFPRNPQLNQEAIEDIVLSYLGAEKVLWLGDGVAGDDTSGHVDDFARFVAPGKIVLAQEANPEDDNYEPLQRAREFLETARDARGQKIEVINLPMPAPRYFDGERLPASYANFYIANDCVLVPTFNDEQDRQALGILGELFPDRHVCGIHAADLVVGLGTLHCSTQQEPFIHT